MQLSGNSLKVARTVIADYFVGTGLIGAAAILFRAPTLLRSLPQQARDEAGWTLTAVVLVLLFLAYVGLQQRTPKKTWTALAVGLQLVQIPVWESSSSSYRFLAGLYAGPLLAERDVSSFYGWGASIHFRWYHQPAESVVGLNAVAVLVVALLCSLTLVEAKLEGSSGRASGSPALTGGEVETSTRDIGP